MGGLSVNCDGDRQRHWQHSLRKHVDICLEGLKIYIQQWIVHKHNVYVWSCNQTCKMMWTDVSAAQQYHLNRSGRSNSVITSQYRIWCSHSGLPDVWALEGCNTASSGSRSQCFKNSECLHLQDQDRSRFLGCLAQIKATKSFQTSGTTHLLTRVTS